MAQRGPPAMGEASWYEAELTRSPHHVSPVLRDSLYQLQHRYCALNSFTLAFTPQQCAHFRQIIALAFNFLESLSLRLLLESQLFLVDITTNFRLRALDRTSYYFTIHAVLFFVFHFKLMRWR